MKFDIIGDIHGHAGKLIKLLEKLEYNKIDGTYQHSDSDRKAVFVGDYIDRGPEIRETLSGATTLADGESPPVYEDDVPVFFGHYWIDPVNSYPPQVQQDHICCLDYSVAKEGLLTAYRWEGEKILRNDRFVWVE